MQPRRSRRAIAPRETAAGDRAGLVAARDIPMLVASLVASNPVAPVGAHRAVRMRLPRARQRSPMETVLLAWGIAGVAALVLVPALRPGPTLGATAVFWLAIAPLLDLAWLRRTALSRIAGRLLRDAAWPLRQRAQMARR
jgi:hypothetical protein